MTVRPTAPRVLVVSASIGEGHDLPARFLVADLLARRPDAVTAIEDGLRAAGPLVERIVLGGSAFDTHLGNVAFDVEYALITHVPPVRRVIGRLGEALGARAMLRLVAEHRPDVVVSTYPGTTEVLGRMRLRGQLGVPVVSAITDLAALRYWSHPGVDLHLITHPESAEEVRAIAGPRTRIVPARGMNDPRFATPPSRAEGRALLGLPAEGKVVVVSGGGWGVGDVEGAVATALALDGVHVVVMCGRNERLRRTLAVRFGRVGRVTLLGFTTEVPALFAGADALIHSTAGLTVLEAWAVGCPVISYGWGRGHIRANNRAYARFGIADVAKDRDALAAALRRALAQRGSPVAAFAQLPVAADVVLDLLAAGHHVGDGG
ncbi:MAG: glycosyltransferase [Actinobacteria bacterium]|nr:glycosyltransferase [Actinomycetota bacterium]